MAYLDALNWLVDTLAATRIVPRQTGALAAALEIGGTVNITGTTTISGPTTISGTLTTTGAVSSGGAVTSDRLPTVNLAAPTQALTAAMSGQTFVAAVDAAFTLPAASVGNGVNFRIITGVASAGTGVTIVRAGADTINTNVSPTGVAITGATTITNTGATDVVGDQQWLVSDGVSVWRGINVQGVWA